MKKKALVAACAALFVAVVACYAAGDAFIGTWKLNEAKSKLTAGGQKNSTVVYTAAGDKVTVAIDGTDADGKPYHSEWTGMYDGKDYPVTGDPTIDTRAYKKVNSHTLSIAGKKDGKVTQTTRVVVSADDGKTRTVTSTATDAKGMKMSTTAVYDKQ
ncbi:MAG TPA: hypothetical protein VLY23_06570 [Candidatus Acidoferrum sp.]|nr:hypothetical protein [Candidatus Acidoferrum sp.]